MRLILCVCFIFYKIVNKILRIFERLIFLILLGFSLEYFLNIFWVFSRLILIVFEKFFINE